MKRVIDLRSDTVTNPSEMMRKAMSSAEVGDDVYGDDPTVNELESISAELLGFEAALFTASGTQANLVAILSHCARGDEYIVGQQAHTYKYEGGGAAVFGSIQPQPIEFEPDSTLDLEKVADKIKPDDIHFARTTLLCLENTQNGKALPLEYLAESAQFCKARNLKLHLDGARLMNAVIRQQLAPRDITQFFDSTTLCLSKGLGAPVGSLLCGTRDLIKQARKWRKMAGGGMRQAGILAAAGIYALENNIGRLQQDHENAQLLAEELKKLPGLQVDYHTNQTNMVFLTLDESLSRKLTHHLKQKNIMTNSGKTIRLVTHMDIDTADIDYTVNTIKTFFNSV